jgi:hypothetical protein
MFAAFVVGMLWLAAMARRRLRALRARVVAAGVEGLMIEVVRIGARWNVTSSLSRDHRLAIREQRRMWLAVEAAQRSVEHARSVGAPVGDLPILARDLATTARMAAHPGVALDRLPGELSETDEVIAAAGRVHAAAVASTRGQGSPVARSIGAAADLERVAIATGMATAHDLG